MKKKKGFTLIELLIVVAIIGILAVAILVGLTSMRTKANLSAFKGEARSSVGGFGTACDTSAAALTTAVSNATAASSNVTFAVTNSAGCGLYGGGIFSVSATPRRTLSVTCDPTVLSPAGVSFPATCK